jgi:hypothetical protein
MAIPKDLAFFMASEAFYFPPFTKESALHIH